VSKVFLITEGLENLGALRTGGQGSVYKGRRMGPVMSAVKVLPTPIHAEDDNDKNFRNFQNEVAKLKMVNAQPNPNVVKILSSGLTESGSLPYIEMEFIEGPDLEDLLQPPHNPVFTIKETLKVAEHLANALAHCHRLGVKHGDVKSNNVKYNIHTGNYILLDFGLAIMTDEQRRSSIKHAGAIEFMAPEQNTGAMLFQTDVYSFGVILFELLAGQVPFPLRDSGETDRHAVMVAHMETTVPDLPELRKSNIPSDWSQEKQSLETQVPPQLLKLIYTCLEKSPDKRYADGMALQEALFKISIGSENAADLQSLALLKEENAALAAQLKAANAKEDGSGHFFKLSYPLMLLLAMVAIAILAFGSYAVFKKPKVQVIVKRDTIIKTKVLRPDTVYREKRSDTTKGSGATAHKKKKKKFLGIF
jgi:serine/threonine protein kinase